MRIPPARSEAIIQNSHRAGELLWFSFLSSHQTMYAAAAAQTSRPASPGALTAMLRPGAAPRLAAARPPPAQQRHTVLRHGRERQDGGSRAAGKVGPSSACEVLSPVRSRSEERRSALVCFKSQRLNSWQESPAPPGSDVLPVTSRPQGTLRFISTSLFPSLLHSQRRLCCRGLE